jgi:class 3 adenylate cyclase
MNGPSVELGSAGEAAVAVESGRDERSRRLFVLRRRQEILAPVRGLIELCRLLLAEEKICGCARAARDLETIQKRAREMHLMVRSQFRPGTAECDAAAHTLNHEMRSLLTIVLGYSEGLHRCASKYFLDAFEPEFDQLRGYGNRILNLVDSTVTRLRCPDGLDGDDDLDRYFKRADGSPTQPDIELAPRVEPGKILVVEDVDPIRNLLCDLLRAQGHEVTPARDGLEGSELVRSRPFDLVLTDIEMPRLSGFELLKLMKEDPALRDLPVVVISGHSELDGVAKCISLGAEDYLPKPFNRVILRARVSACLEKKRLRDRAEQQRKRYDELLHAILPARVVEELSKNDTFPPCRRDRVAVLFADIVEFTPYCDQFQDRPEVIVGHLQRLFEAWEEISGRYGVQKIKTIGDAFMAASGLLEESQNPVLDCVEFGIEIIRYTQRLADSQGQPLGFNLRVGIHAGPVVAGIIGRRQSLYDLWGDTVNTAARLESHGKPGCVNLSPDAWEYISDLVRGEIRETCKLKGKAHPIEVIQLDPDLVQGLVTRPAAGALAAG